MTKLRQNQMAAIFKFLCKVAKQISIIVSNVPCRIGPHGRLVYVVIRLERSGLISALHSTNGQSHSRANHPPLFSDLFFADHLFFVHITTMQTLQPPGRR